VPPEDAELKGAILNTADGAKPGGALMLGI